MTGVAYSEPSFYTPILSAETGLIKSPRREHVDIFQDYVQNLAIPLASSGDQKL